MMRKQYITALLCVGLLTGGLSAKAQSNEISISLVIGENSININNNYVTDVSPYLVNDTTLVPLRVISEGLGANVDWDGENESITINKDDINIELTLNSNTALLNGTQTSLSTAPELKDNTTMVPIRFISEALGADVQWEQESMKITITSKKNTADIAKIDNSNWKYNAEDGVYWQTGIQYCSNPVDLTYETLGIFVPEEYMNAVDNGDGTFTCTFNYDNELSGYNVTDAPIVIPVNTPGYMAMKAPTGYVSEAKSYTDKGFIYVNAGCRGRDHGAPAGVTDLKAAIRYIRYNGSELPGNKDRIFSFGMSGGGAQSALLGASGDSDLYTPYLQAIGAVEGVSDSVMGSMCWCPVTNLDYADAAYEWNMGFTRSGLSDEEQQLSNDLAEEFAVYLNQLGLKNENGEILTLSESENGIYMSGSYYEYIKSVIENSLNNFLSDTEFPYTKSSNKGGFGDRGGRPGMGMGDAGFDEVNFEEIDGIDRIEVGGEDDTQEDVTYNTAEEYIDSLNKDITWINYDSTTNTATITSVEDFVKVCKKASKSMGAFDDLNAKQGENTLFGYGDGVGSHFDAVMAELLQGTEYGDAYANDLSKTDSLGNTIEYRMNMYNPMYYLNDYYDGYNTSNVADYWRIRTGINQGDTALSTEVNLSLALANYGKNVDFETVWGEGHTKAERTGNPTDNFIEWVNECLNNSDI